MVVVMMSDASHKRSICCSVYP